jgi:ketosteroid isomerase-like protein
MKKILVLLTIMVALSSPLHPQEQEDERQARRGACLDACMRERPNPELQRQELVALEKETARAILLGDATFFRRVYSDDFSGVSSHGQIVDKEGLISAVQAQEIRYESFTASDVKVRLYRDLAVVSSSWSMRGLSKGQRVNSQMRVMHVYMYTGSGYRVVSAQTTLLPPYIQQPL